MRVPLDTVADANISPWDAATSSSQDLAVANSWAGTEMIPPHMMIEFTKDLFVTKLDLSAMATCWKLRVPAVRMFWSTNTFSFEAPLLFRSFIGYHSMDVLRQIRHLNILFHPIMTLARWWHRAFDQPGKSALQVFPNLDTLHVTLIPRYDGGEVWATHTKVCTIPVLKFWKANLSHVPLTIGRARYQGWENPEYTEYMHKSIMFGLASGHSFLEDAQWQLSHGLAAAEKGQLRTAAFGDSVNLYSAFPYPEPKYPFPREIEDMETDLPVAEHSDDEDSDCAMQELHDLHCFHAYLSTLNRPASELLAQDSIMSGGRGYSPSI